MLSFLPLDVLDEIWDLIKSVSEGFLTYCLVLSVAWISGVELMVSFCSGIIVVRFDTQGILRCHNTL